MRLISLEEFAKTVNDMDSNLPKGRSICFDIGSWGGCGLGCDAFLDGECEIVGDIFYSKNIDEDLLIDLYEQEYYQKEIKSYLEDIGKLELLD